MCDEPLRSCKGGQYAKAELEEESSGGRSVAVGSSSHLSGSIGARKKTSKRLWADLQPRGMKLELVDQSERVVSLLCLEPNAESAGEDVSADGYSL